MDLSSYSTSNDNQFGQLQAQQGYPNAQMAEQAQQAHVEAQVASNETLIGVSGGASNYGGLSSAASQQLAAYALAQEANKAASKLNAELCGNFSIGIQHENGGVFTSPNYPNPYPVNLICTRLIEAPVGHYIVLEFRDQFIIEEAGYDCDNDKIEIRDGRYGYSKVLARYCGTKFPPEVKSTNEAMWLRFISDASISHTGFKAVYRFEKQKNIKPNPPFECRFNVTANNGTSENRTGIHSGVIRNTDVPDKLLNYTRDFNVSLECIWNITVLPGWKIYLTFSNYELNKPNDCDSNFIEIYEENLTEENQTVKFCGTRTEPQQSKSNIFNIRHHALPTASGSRFEIIYTAFRDKGLGGCDAREFDCDDGTCIHESLKCDGQVNCKYRYDEASDPGPCQGDIENSFFETEHMVIILIVFLSLVTAMCASIIVSCWGKIQERRRRKQEYHMRKSREASMEGQLNKVDQVLCGSNDRANATNNSRQRVAASVIPSENHIQANSEGQRFLNSEALLQQQQQELSGVHYQHPLMNSQMLADETIGNYGVYNGDQIMASQTSLDIKRADGGKNDMSSHHQAKQMNMFGSRSRVHDYAPEVNKSLQNVKQSMLATMAAQKGQQQQQVDLNKQQSVPDVSFNNQYKIPQTGGAGTATNQQQQIPSLTGEALAHDTQQMLNLSLARQQQQQRKLLSSIYQQQQQHKLPLDNISINNNNNNNNNSSSNSNSLVANQIGRFLRHRQNVGGINGIPGGFLNQSAVAQTMPISLTKYNMLQQQTAGDAPLPPHMGTEQAVGQQQQLNYDTSARTQLAAYNQQRALTLSTVHQPQQQRNLQSIYGFSQQQQQGLPLNGNNLSNSITCCNVLGDCMTETPLISDLVARANQQRMQYPQNNRVSELRSATIGPRMPNTAIPRSISAHQLSRSQLRQSAQNQQHQQHQQQQQVHQLSFKSMSDAGHAGRHQPPNHSLSYPHACTGPHVPEDQQQQRGKQSPALPPPPPPPNLVQVRGSTACGNLPPSNQQIDSRRAAFKVSRLDASQLTGDTIQDAELIVGNMPLSSMQFDEPSSESDATFGMLMNSIGNAPMNFPSVSHSQPGPSQQQQLRQQTSSVSQQMGQQQQHPLFIGQTGIKQQVYQPQARILSHLSDCNLIRRQRASMMNRQQDILPNQPLVCDCGALERANQMRQQQQHLHLQEIGSSHEFDDSEDGPFIMQATLRPGSFEVNNMILSQNVVGQLKSPHSNLNEPLYGRQQQYRFRQQSSEMTGEDEDEDEEMDGYNIEPDDEVSSDTLPDRPVGDMKMEYSLRSVVRNEELRDGPGRHMSGSHTSISCQSCTCGSQLQLDQVGGEEESSNSKSGDTTNQAVAIDNQAPAKNSVVAVEKVVNGSAKQLADLSSSGTNQPSGDLATRARGDSSSKSTKKCDINNAGCGTNTSSSSSNNNNNKTQILNKTTN